MPFFDTLEKPTLLLNVDQAKKNIAFMADKARQAGVRFRPHFKTHQSLAIGEWFREQGVKAITVSSVDMAQYFAGGGWQDVTIAFPFNLHQARAARELSERVRLGLLVENAAALEALDSAGVKAGIWLKIDGGAHRTGLPWDQFDEIIAVAQKTQKCGSLRLRGLLTHAGNTYGAGSRDLVVERFHESVERLNQVRIALDQAGIHNLEISVGDTPGCVLSPNLSGVDEIRPGNFVFYDAEQTAFGTCRPEQVAVALACPVVACHPERSEAVVYGGAIHLSKDFYEQDGRKIYGLAALPQGKGWGAPVAGAYVRSVSQEHGVIQMPADVLARVSPGDWICLLPAHSCLTVTAMRDYLTLDGQVIHTMNS